MLQHHQGHLTLSNVGYSTIRVLCSDILLLQNGLKQHKEDVQNLKKPCFERNAAQKQDPCWQW